MWFDLGFMLLVFTYLIVPLFSYFIAHWFTLKWLLPTFSKLKKPLLLVYIFSTIGIIFSGLVFAYLATMAGFLDRFGGYVMIGLKSGELFLWIINNLPQQWHINLDMLATLPVLVYSLITFVALAQIIFLIFYAKRVGISRCKMIKPALIASITGWIVAHVCGVLAHIALAITVG